MTNFFSLLLSKLLQNETFLKYKPRFFRFFLSEKNYMSKIYSYLCILCGYKFLYYK